MGYVGGLVAGLLYGKAFAGGCPLGKGCHEFYGTGLPEVSHTWTPAVVKMIAVFGSRSCCAIAHKVPKRLQPKLQNPSIEPDHGCYNLFAYAYIHIHIYMYMRNPCASRIHAINAILHLHRTHELQVWGCCSSGPGSCISWLLPTLFVPTTLVPCNSIDLVNRSQRAPGAAPWAIFQAGLGNTPSASRAKTKFCQSALSSPLWQSAFRLGPTAHRLPSAK